MRNHSPGKGKASLIVAICLGLLLSVAGCALSKTVETTPEPTSTSEAVIVLPTASHRPVYNPGELVSYSAQSGDSLPMLASRFNTSEEAIRKANPIIPASVSTLPQGLPMQIPIYYAPFWGSAFQMIPNSAFIFTSDAESFDLRKLNLNKSENPEIVQLVSALEANAKMFRQTCLEASIDPRLMISIIAYGLRPEGEFQQASRTMIEKIKNNDPSLLQHWMGVLNEGYYRFETGKLVELELPDGSIEQLDPWQNAGSAALRFFFSMMVKTPGAYRLAVDPDGLARTYTDLFGDPWEVQSEVLPGSLEWLPAGLPIDPQGGWQAALMPEQIRKMMPWPGAAAGFHASIQDASNKGSYGKVFSSISGTITRLDNFHLVVSEPGMPETKGWSIVYFGVTAKPGLKAGDEIQIGQTLGQVDSVNWNASFWLARKYNGEWVPAGTVIPFKLGGWKLALDDSKQNLVMHKPELTVYSQPYQGQTNLIPNY